MIENVLFSNLQSSIVWGTFIFSLNLQRTECADEDFFCLNHRNGETIRK